MKERLHLIIHGDVQGVFFRAGTQEEARRLGLVGFVRNLPDGSVEAVAEGERDALSLFLAWCSRGPAGADVQRIEKEWMEAKGGFSDFEVSR